VARDPKDRFADAAAASVAMRATWAPRPGAEPSPGAVGVTVSGVVEKGAWQQVPSAGPVSAPTAQSAFAPTLVDAETLSNAVRAGEGSFDREAGVASSPVSAEPSRALPVALLVGGVLVTVVAAALLLRGP